MVKETKVFSLSQEVLGMTLRDWFAGQALQGYLSGSKQEEPWELGFFEMAAHTYEIADAMIAARSEDSQAPKVPIRIRIEECECSIRVLNAFKFLGIETLDQAAKFTERDFFRLENFGRKSLNELKHHMATAGLSFALDPSVWKP